MTKTTSETQRCRAGCNKDLPVEDFAAPSSQRKLPKAKRPVCRTCYNRIQNKTRAQRLKRRQAGEAISKDHAIARSIRGFNHTLGLVLTTQLRVIYKAVGERTVEHTLRIDAIIEDTVRDVLDAVSAGASRLGVVLREEKAEQRDYIPGPLPVAVKRAAQTLGFDTLPKEWLTVKRRYRELALRYHPDRAGDVGNARAQEVNGAYTLLKEHYNG